MTVWGLCCTAEALRPAGAAWSKGLGCCPTSPCKARGFVHTKTLLAAAVLVPQRPACRGLALLFYSCRKIRKILQTRYVRDREALYHRFRTGCQYVFFIIVGTNEWRAWVGDSLTGKITEVYECKKDSDGIYQGKAMQENVGSSEEA